MGGAASPAALFFFSVSLGRMNIVIQLTDIEIKRSDTDALAVMIARGTTPARGLRQLLGQVEVITPPEYWDDPMDNEHFLTYCRKLRSRIPHFVFFASLRSDFYFNYFLAQCRETGFRGGAFFRRSIPFECGIFSYRLKHEKSAFDRFAQQKAEFRPEQIAERFATITRYLQTGGNSL